MQIITFNTSGSVINRDADSCDIRIAYLLGQTVALGGNIVHDFAFQRIMDSASFKLKVDFLEKIYNNETNYNPGINYDSIRNLIKGFAANKNKTTHVIAAYQKLERSFSTILNGVLKNYSDKLLISSGFIAIHDLIDEKTIKVFLTDFVEPEKRFKDKVKASSLLGLDFDETSPTKLFLLNENFFLQPFADSYTCVNADHPDAGLETNVLIEPLFSIPNPASLKIAELRLIRNDLANVRQRFYERTEAWINLAYNGTDIEERKNMLQTGIKTSAEEIKKLFYQHPNIKHLEMVTNNRNAIDIYIGEIPFQFLLNYFFHYKIIKEETLEKMKALKENEERFDRRWPVLFYKRADANTDFRLNVDSSEMQALSLKKTISID